MAGSTVLIVRPTTPRRCCVRSRLMGKLNTNPDYAPNPTELPPGVSRNGTRLQSRGRWYDAPSAGVMAECVRSADGLRSQRLRSMVSGVRCFLGKVMPVKTFWRLGQAKNFIYTCKRRQFFRHNPDRFCRGACDSCPRHRLRCRRV